VAIVKVKPVRYSKNLGDYLKRETDPGDVVYAHDCNEEDASADFEALRQFHKGKGEVEAYHIIQSWNSQESKMLSAEEFNVIGRQMVEAQFPDHPYVVRTHVETGKTHNHIYVSPWKSQGGNKIENKKRLLYQLREKNDALCQERGLSVINGAAKDRQAKLPEKAKNAAKFRGNSWLFDLTQKADFARSYATSYDQYVGFLGELGVRVQVEDKNISYFYSEGARGKRGSKMGVRYDKEGLERAFKSNEEKFARVPGLREQVRGLAVQAASGKDSKNAAANALLGLPNTTYERGYKNYGAYTKANRPGRPQRYAHEMDVSQSVIPMEQLRKARNASIFSYCKMSNIALERTDEGRFTLKGRPFVDVSEFEWVNKRNKTKGSLIEFVAAHKNMTFLQAVAEINGNKRLLLLEQHLGETKRSFTSFYIPKEKQLKELDSLVKIGQFLSSHGADPHHATALFKNNQAQVHENGRVHLFAKDDDGGTFEFVESKDHKWNRTKTGSFNKPFFAVSTNSRKATVYADPFSFLKTEGKHALWPVKHRQDVIALMEPETKAIGQHLAANRHIIQLEIFTDSKSKQSATELDFFNNLKAHCAPFGIQVKQIDGRDRDRSRETELPSL
jgi:hypothetical protein